MLSPPASWRRSGFAARLLHRAIYSLGPLALRRAYAAFGYARRKAGSR
jgi:hypothetical protein